MKVSKRYCGVWIALVLACCWVETSFSQKLTDQPLPFAKNDEGVRIDVLPGERVLVGAKISFQIETKQAGYLIVVDVDTAGKVSQIYPNANYLLASGIRSFSNHIKPGQVLTIPEPGNPYTGFVFVASPPPGIALSMAILSDQSVQFLDLPDVPLSMTGRLDAFNYLTSATRALQLTASGGRLIKPKWSFGMKFYRVE